MRYILHYEQNYKAKYVVKAHSKTVISTESIKINPASSVNMATWTPTFAIISKVPTFLSPVRYPNQFN